jgi:SAM-dependent MidA family methyltransferase
MSVGDYMAECLLHPRHGYYATRDPLGRMGDFITAPEISQAFGEVLGLCLVQAWIDQGHPLPVRLAELGPGRGTLMMDVRRATRRFAPFAEAEVHLVEASPALRREQARLVEGAVWHDTAATLPEGPLFLLANEFLDALPIRQFVRRGRGWAERVVGLEGDRLAWGLAPPGPVAALEHRLWDTGEGEVVEVCPALPTIVGEVGRRVAQGGAALFIDYGGWRSRGDTLQAVRAHAFADPLEAPGEADLTAHVDFEAVAAAAAPARATPPVPQGAVLERLGIGLRLEALARADRGRGREWQMASLRRLTHPDEMGTLFQVMGLHPPAAPPPPGLA